MFLSHEHQNQHISTVLLRQFRINNQVGTDSVYADIRVAFSSERKWKMSSAVSVLEQFVFAKPCVAQGKTQLQTGVI